MSFRAGAVTARGFARAAAVKVETPAMLTCAVSGGVVTTNPNQPATRDEVVAAAVAAARAGASILHIHARGANGEITQAPEEYLAIKQAIREQVRDVVLSFTTGGQLGAPAEESRRSLEAQPEIATVTCGSMNFGLGGELLVSPPASMRELVEQLAGAGIVPEYECFDIGMAHTAAALARPAGGTRGLMHLLLGVVGGAPASPAVIELFSQMAPSGVPWMVTAISRHFPMMAVTLALGGHIRTGLEDVVYVAPGEYADSNAQLVTRARALCDAIGRPVATPSQARELLGIGAV
jgi:3-keto-5-aminohexanoate cleavage enzyme